MLLSKYSFTRPSTLKINYFAKLSKDFSEHPLIYTFTTPMKHSFNRGLDTTVCRCSVCLHNVFSLILSFTNVFASGGWHGSGWWGRGKGKNKTYLLAGSGLSSVISPRRPSAQPEQEAPRLPWPFTMLQCSIVIGLSVMVWGSAREWEPGHVLHPGFNATWVENMRSAHECLAGPLT